MQRDEATEGALSMKAGNSLISNLKAIPHSQNPF